MSVLLIVAGTAVTVAALWCLGWWLAALCLGMDDPADEREAERRAGHW